MTSETTTEFRIRCPVCGRKAKRVPLATVRALLKDEFASQLGTDHHSCCESNSAASQPITSQSGWRFCDSQDCDVVYLSEQSDSTFTKSQLKVDVGVKETSGDRPLCYCFSHSVASIKEELHAKGCSDVFEDIRAKMKGPGCRCETENPSGACCLGSIAQGIRIAQHELATTLSNEEPSGSRSFASRRGGQITKVGTLVSAVMASSCCWLPLVLLAVGISGSGIASMLEAYRPLFVVVTVGFLGAAFYFTYRPQNSTVDAASDCCATGSSDGGNCCAPITRGEFKMVTLNKAMLWFVTALATAFLFFPSYVGALMGGGDGQTVTDNMNRATITVEGMTCEGCAALVAEAIQTVPGVVAVDVDFEKSQAVVGTEICCPVPTKDIVTALDKVGYSATFVGFKDTPGIDANQPSACCVVRDRETNGIVLLSDEDDTVQAKQEAPMLQDLSKDAGALKSAFNEHIGNARVILLVSPG